MEIGTYRGSGFASNGLRTRWSSTAFARLAGDGASRKEVILVFAIEGPIVTGQLQAAMNTLSLPSALPYPVGLLVAQIATIVAKEVPAIVVVTGKGIYVS